VGQAVSSWRILFPRTLPFPRKSSRLKVRFNLNPQMNSLRDSLAYWTTVLGTVVAFFGLIQSLSWLAGIGAILVVGSIAAVAYGRTQRQLLNRATIRVEDRSMDSLNMANLRRRVNRSLVIQEASNTATIRGEDLTVHWVCTGYCQTEHESAIEFSIDSDNVIPFAELNCFAYDLRNDPGKKHRIRPVLIGPDGMSKKIALPFLAPLGTHDPFKIELTCELPRCMKARLDYYTATVSFDQERVPRYTVTLAFEGQRPEWVRIYECDPTGTSRLLRELAPETADGARAVYIDVAEDLPAQSARVYFFERDYVLDRGANCAEAADLYSTL
jgi:hypothetical protein